MKYANGDEYDGHWDKDIRHGQGKLKFDVTYSKSTNRTLATSDLVSHIGLDLTGGPITVGGDVCVFRTVYRGAFEDGMWSGAGTLTEFRGEYRVSSSHVALHISMHLCLIDFFFYGLLCLTKNLFACLPGEFFGGYEIRSRSNELRKP